MKKKLTISDEDEKVPFPAAVRGSKTPVLKLSNDGLNVGPKSKVRAKGSFCELAVLHDLHLPAHV